MRRSISFNDISLKGRQIDDLIVSLAIPMLGGHVLDPRLLGVEVTIAVPARRMVWALYVVLPPRFGTLKVDVAVIAGPVGVGVLLVLF
jgi:hypothetical protein